MNIRVVLCASMGIDGISHSCRIAGGHKINTSEHLTSTNPFFPSDHPTQSAESLLVLTFLGALQTPTFPLRLPGKTKRSTHQHVRPLLPVDVDEIRRPPRHTARAICLDTRWEHLDTAENSKYGEFSRSWLARSRSAPSEYKVSGK